jgi:hypothetical protein
VVVGGRERGKKDRGRRVGGSGPKLRHLLSRHDPGKSCDTYQIGEVSLESAGGNAKYRDHPPLPRIFIRFALPGRHPPPKKGPLPSQAAKMWGPTPPQKHPQGGHSPWGFPSIPSNSTLACWDISPTPHHPTFCQL